MDASDRRAARAALHALAAGDARVLAPGHRLHASHPWGAETGGDAPWAALRAAFGTLERRDAILVAGDNHPDPRTDAIMPDRAPRLVAAMGSYLGRFERPLLGIPPTHGVAMLDYGEAHWIEDGSIRASWLMWDLAALMIRAGSWPLAAPLGAPGLWPAPATQDGLRPAPEPGESGASLARVLEMHDILHAYANGPIEEIDMRHWHPDFLYWAGGGIGAARGVDGFRAHHQIPYRRAFPRVRGIGHFVRLSDGPYAVTGGDLAVTHSGAEYLGCGPSGRELTFRVMDFYRLDADGLIAENWLPNDTLGLLAQMGVDALARVAHHGGAPRRGL